MTDKPVRPNLETKMPNLDDWLKTYYPVPANLAAQGTDLEAIDHCLRKWQGAVDAAQYGLKYQNWCLVDSAGHRLFWFDNESCALCEKYTEDDEEEQKCYDEYGQLCPFCKHTGRMCPYPESRHDPLPMITTLQRIKLAEQSKPINLNMQHKEEPKMYWNPAEKFKDDDRINISGIDGPPCIHCKHWNPQRRFLPTDKGMVYCGVILCHSEQEPDFMCFNER